MGTEKPYIVLWRELAEQSLGWENSGQWGDYDFEKLSEIIFEKTNTRLSISTLKRIWEKVRYDSSPTTITLNALAQYLDFSDWRAFRKQMDQDKISAPSVPDKKISTAKKYFWSSVLIVAVALFVLSWAVKVKRKTVSVPGRVEAKFDAKVVTDNAPNSVVFDYDASAYHSDNVYIQQSWDPRRREKVSSNGRQYISIYYYPGYFNAKLVVNGQIKKEKPVFIKTKGWMALIDKDPAPAYMDSSALHLPGALGISNQTFGKLTRGAGANEPWVYFFNSRDFDGLDGSDFVFETTLKNTSLPEQSSCHKASVQISGTKEDITIPLADKGCIGSLNLSVANKMVYGKQHDLSAFGCGFNDFQHITLAVKNKRLNVSLNNKVIFTTLMDMSIGKITGLRYGFEGTGEIRDIKLGDEKKIVYQEDFRPKADQVTVASN
jgi:hypothetical protein